MKVAIVKIYGCFDRTSNGGAHGCPYRDMYRGEPGCSFNYGELPKTGFPTWCPLSKEEVKENE
jgi:hypothetical protein